MSVIPNELLLPLRTISGAGSIDRLIPECLAFGSRGMIVYGRSLSRKGVLARILDTAPSDESVCIWRHPGGEPTLDQLEDLLTAARGHGADWIAGVGGGSVMDIAKAAAGLLEAQLSALDYHDGAELEASRIPFIAAPTTAGTGSESTTVSVLTNAALPVKRSIRHTSFMARCVILDPELLLGCPRHVIASAGMDAMTQAIEAFTSRHATALSDDFARRAVRMINESLPAVYRGEEGDALESLLQGSYLAGIALSNARLGIVHGLAHPLGARYHQPHGVVCSVCLLPALLFNRTAIGDKYNQLATDLGADPVVRIQSLVSELEIVSPFRGKALTDRNGIVQEVLASGSTAANPRDVTQSDVEALLRSLFA
jgi:alcohol dehydrogenase class IV